MAEPAREDGRLSLTILGGYLGAGKSTWLRHQLYAGQFGTAHVLVNEAAETPVDHLMLSGACQLTLLAGGCACCDGQAEMIAALRDICDDASRAGRVRIDRIVLETSGLADPGRIAEAVRGDPVLVRRIALDRIIVLVDGINAQQQLARERLGRRQIETADRLVVTKVDAAKPEALARLVATLRVLNPAATLEASVRGETVALEVDESADPFPLSAADDDDRPIRPARISLGPGDNWVALSTWLSAVLHARGDDVVRVKGVVRTPAGRLLLQSVRRIVQPPEILPETDDPGQDNVIVFIGRGFDADALARSYRAFSGAA